MLFDFLRDRETIKELRKELREARAELAMHELENWQRGLPATPEAIGYGWVTEECLEKNSVAHFDLTEPKIERREHSDVLFIQVEDLLR